MAALLRMRFGTLCDVAACRLLEQLPWHERAVTLVCRAVDAALASCIQSVDAHFSCDFGARNMFQLRMQLQH
jgi:hypothetical protein